MNSRSELSFYEQIEAVRDGESSKDQIAELRKAIEEERQHELEIQRLAEERREMIAEHGIDSSLQRMVNLDSR